jgi:plasmid maintenance system antidote protein VapI
MTKRSFKSLAAFLKHTHTTQVELAEALGIPQSRVSVYVNGKALPRPALALRLSAYTGVPIEALVRARSVNAGER